MIQQYAEIAEHCKFKSIQTKSFVRTVHSGIIFKRN